MKNKICYLLLFLALTMESCQMETGGPSDFMSGQFSVIDFLIKNWWLIVAFFAVLILIGLIIRVSELINKKKDK